MILLHYLTRLFYLLPILSRAKMAKKGRLALSRRPLLPSLLQVPNWSESSSTLGTYRFLSCWGAAAIGGTCLGRLSGGDTRQRKVMYSLTHSLTYHYVRYMYLGSNTGYVCKEDGRGNCACAAACAAATAVVRSGQARSGQVRYL